MMRKNRIRYGDKAQAVREEALAKSSNPAVVSQRRMERRIAWLRDFKPVPGVEYRRTKLGVFRPIKPKPNRGGGNDG